MNNKEIIKRAQSECGEYVTGYRYDITIDSLRSICEAMWNRAKNLSYTITEWVGEVADVLGKKAFLFWLPEIEAFKYEKLNALKYSVFHGQRYCL